MKIWSKWYSDLEPYPVNSTSEYSLEKSIHLTHSSEYACCMFEVEIKSPFLKVLHSIIVLHFL